MTLQEIVQKEFELEMKSLSFQARKIVFSNFFDYSRLMVFHEHGPYSFNTVTSNEYIQQELFDFSKRIFTIYVKVQLDEWKKNAIHDISFGEESQIETVVEKYLKQVYLLILKEEGQFVQKTIKNNCPNYAQALSFVKKEKSVNDFLRCSERQRRQLNTFFSRFADIYNEIIPIYVQKRNEIKKRNESLNTSTIISHTPSTNNAKVPRKKDKTNSKKLKKSPNSPPKTSIKVDNEPQRFEDENNEEKNVKQQKSKKNYVSSRNNFIIESSDLDFYFAPIFSLDDLTMIASINYGCYGSVSYGLSPKFIAFSYNELDNIERNNNKYDPDEMYHRPIVSDKVYRSAHRYKWFGVNGIDYKLSFYKYGIVAICTNLYFGEYKCYVPVEVDEYEGDCVAEIETSDDMLVDILRKRTDLINFLEHEDISLRDFKLLEITNKLYYLCDYYDIYDFLGLDEELYYKEDVALTLQASMSKKTVDEYLWDSYTLDEKNSFLSSRLKAFRNKEAYLRFTIVKAVFIPSSKEIELSYLIHSEYSIEVFINVGVIYKDGSSYSYHHINVESYDDRFEYFQGRMRIMSDQDYLNIEEIQLSCTDE